MADQFDNNKDNDQEQKYEKFCFLCRRPESQAGKMIDLPNNIHICADCMQKSFDTMNTQMRNGNYSDLFNMPNVSMIDLSSLQNPGNQAKKIKKKSETPRPVIDLKDIPAPHKIKATLDEYVIGQEYAKKVMSVGVYNHYKRVATDTMDDIEIEKSNMLMIGPTGSGKTYLVKTLAKLLDVPLAITDATSLTEAGYIGDDIESVVSKLLAAADNDVDKAEQGIIFIDEIDKIAKKKNTSQRDVSGESVQQGMLKLLEGSEVEVPVGANSKNAMVPLTTVNTKNILFICGGAFDGLEKIVEKRKGSSVIGFESLVQSKQELDSTDWMKEVTAHDLVKYGIIPELIGRLPVITALSGLDTDALVKILTVPKNSIVQQYKKLFELDGVELLFEEEALRAIAQQAQDQHTGARGLRGIMEDILTDLMFEAPSDPTIDKIIITEGVIKNGAAPQITRKKELLQTNSVKLTQKDAKKRQKRSTAS